ncbi:MAG: biopolymer transporter ExbD [Pseudomonadota bacterium]
MLDLAPRRRSRRASLTPMIDVVFLLLVFFMLAARFGTDFAVPMNLASGGDGYSGPPRIVDVLPEGERLNGVPMTGDTLLAELATLMETPDDAIILRPGEGAVLQRVIDVMAAFESHGFTTLVLVE